MDMLRFWTAKLPSIFSIAPRFACRNGLPFIYGKWITDFYCPPMDCRLLKENGLPKLEGSRMSYVKARNDGFL